MARLPDLEVGNFVCRTGERVLLDVFDGFVYPAFMANFERESPRGKFLFRDVQLVSLAGDAPEGLAICGRLVRDTVLRRTHILQENALVRSEAEMPAAISSFFCLVLATHRLLYVRTEMDAPTLGDFKSTIWSFLRNLRKTYISNQVALVPREERREERRRQEADFPPFRVELVALPNQQALADVVTSFHLLQRVTVTLIDVNDDVDHEPLWERLRGHKEQAGATRTSVVDQAKDGLDKAGVVRELQELDPGLSKIRLNGTDETGNEISSTEEDFKVRIPVGELGEQVRPAVERMWGAFERVVRAGTIPQGQMSRRVDELLRGLRARLPFR